MKMGSFVNNYILRHLGGSCDNLQRLILSSDNIDDEGMTFVLSRAYNLMHIDVSLCKSINGYCFEDLITKQLKKLIVSFDEHRIRCTNTILLTLDLWGKTVVVNRAPKRR